jgi:hypothetical protein
LATNHSPRRRWILFPATRRSASARTKWDLFKNFSSIRFQKRKTSDFIMTMIRKCRVRTSERIALFCRNAGVSSGRDAVRVHAKRILAEYGKTAPPFDAWELCRLRGIEVQTKYLRGCDARLLPVPGSYIAEVHSEHRRARQSFSLCHELGHTLFDDGSNGNSKCDMATSDREHNDEERLCDAIASELLMPEDVFAREAIRREPSWNEVHEIANMFGVSGEAAVNRIRDLDIWRCVHLTLRPTTMMGVQETFAVEWIEPSESLKRNPVGTAFLVQRIMDWLHSEGSRVFRMKGPCEAALGLSTPLLLSGHYFKAGGNRFARLLAAISVPQIPLREELCAASAGQLALFAAPLPSR